MAKRNPGTPPKYGYIIVNEFGLFGMYTSRRAAMDEATGKTDRICLYKLAPKRKRKAAK